MSTKTNYIGYKLITNIKKGDLLGYFLPSKISQLAYSIETLESRAIAHFSQLDALILKM